MAMRCRQHDLTKVLFDEVGTMLEERGLLMRQGTTLDATIIAAPPATKTRTKPATPRCIGKSVWATNSTVRWRRIGQG